MMVMTIMMMMMMTIMMVMVTGITTHTTHISSMCKYSIGYQLNKPTSFETSTTKSPSLFSASLS